jgi:hypothetical protein
LNNWIKQKFISAVISAIVIASIASVETRDRQTLALPSSAVNQVVKKSTVRIEGGAKGSGVIVAKDDYGYLILTNRHVIENSGEYQIVTADGKSHPVTEIQKLKGADLALVYFDTNEKYAAIARSNSDTLTEGQKIYIAGYPGEQEIASNRTYRFMSESLIGFLDPSDIQDGYELIYSGESVPGMSGSPIVNEEGQLVGIYGNSDIDFASGATYLYGIPLNTALKIATRSGIELNEEQDVANQPNTNVDLFAPSPGNSAPGIDLFDPSSETSTTTASNDGNDGNAGLEIVGSAEINNFTIPEITYTGECPGRGIGNQEAMFFSNTTTTAADRRVIITNLTRGLKRDPLPYTDREYESGQVSEETEVTLGSEHETQNFVVLAGQNQLKYEIVQVEEDNLETILEEGTFLATATTEEIFVKRRKEPREETYCPGNRESCEEEEKLVRTVYECP